MEIPEELKTALARIQALEKAAGFCRLHQPDGGERNCLVCAVEMLSRALSEISYLCGEPNEMHVSEYDTHYSELAVVEQVKRKLQARKE
jgi:hypothetical protein